METSIFQEIYLGVLGYLPKLPSVILVIGGGVFFIRFLKKAVTRVLLSVRIEQTIVHFVAASLSFACWVFLVSLIFSVLGFPQISLAFSGSIALVIVGIATNANSVIQDLLAGLFLLADPDFKVGCRVRVQSVVGEVVGVDIKKTKIRDDEGNLHVVSNKVFDSASFIIERQREQRVA